MDQVNQSEQSCNNSKEKELADKPILEFTYVVGEIEPHILAKTKIFSSIGNSGHTASEIVGQDLVGLYLVDSELEINIASKDGQVSYQFPDEASRRFTLLLRSPETIKAFQIGRKYKVSVSAI